MPQLQTPLILALSAYNSKMSSVTPIIYYQIVISMINCNFLQSLKNFMEGVQSHLQFSKIVSSAGWILGIDADSVMP